MFTGPRVLVSSAATGRYHCPGLALPQVREDRLLDVDFVCFPDESRPTRERAMTTPDHADRGYDKDA